MSKNNHEASAADIEAFKRRLAAHEHQSAPRGSAKPPSATNQAATIATLEAMVAHLTAQIAALDSGSSSATPVAPATSKAPRHDADTQARLDNMVDRGRDMAKSTKLVAGCKQTFSHVGKRK